MANSTEPVKSILDFLEKLKDNNNRDWMQDNKKTYQAAKQNFEAITADTLTDLIAIEPDMAGLDPKKCTFRLNRDTRFSKDKAPYKTNFGAYFAEGGKKSGNAGYYLHLEPGQCFLGAGIYMPDGEQLKKIRQEIDYNASELKAVTEKDKFAEYFGAIKGDKLKRAPKGYDPSHPNIELLKLKSYFVTRPLTDEQVTSPDLRATVAESFDIVRPFVEYLNAALS
ncbi:TIGR02453 family protein [Fulvitalea axinellae]|uniref:TIGR02453 family protein n=1 Tax=Fulvitalea axinellae TaxID=1182444 RepID=A0AAU9CIN7_9BACT|nr:TIGR02453 family protein [Fulvitalea axinellae]